MYICRAIKPNAYEEENSRCNVIVYVLSIIDDNKGELMIDTYNEPPEELERTCAFCGEPCNKEFCSKECKKANDED